MAFSLLCCINRYYIYSFIHVLLLISPRQTLKLKVHKGVHGVIHVDNAFALLATDITSAHTNPTSMP